MDDYVTEIKRDNPSIPGRELDKKVQEAERWHTELLGVSQVAESVPPMLVDLDKVQMKDTLEAIGAANEKEAHDTINRMA